MPLVDVLVRLSCFQDAVPDHSLALMTARNAESAARRWTRLMWVLFAALGPGLIAASAGNDAGGVLTYASAGAEFVYRALFLMVVITVAYVVVQEMVARLAVHTGKGLAALIREEFPLRVTALAIAAFAIANLGLMVTEFGGIATAFNLFGVSRYLSVPIAAAAIWALVLFGSYRYAERIFLLLTMVFITYPIAAILGHPNWGKVLASTAWPHLVGNKAFVLLAVALIGTTITPYIQLYEAGAVVDKGTAPGDYKLARLDAISGAIVSNVVAMAIIVATAAAIGGTGVLQSASHAAHALRPVAGPAAVALFGLGLLGASALAAAVVPLSTSYAVAEAIGVERSVSSSFRQAPLFLGLFTTQILIGAAVVLVPGNLIALIINTQVLEGVLTPVTLILILILANRRSLLGTAANGPMARWIGGISIISVAAVASFYVVETFLGWFGLG
jgi:Mn2+/Fe2+ NRAMP family transporter